MDKLKPEADYNERRGWNVEKKRGAAASGPTVATLIVVRAGCDVSSDRVSINASD